MPKAGGEHLRNRNFFRKLCLLEGRIVGLEESNKQLWNKIYRQAELIQSLRKELKGSQGQVNLAIQLIREIQKGKKPTVTAYDSMSEGEGKPLPPRSRNRKLASPISSSEEQDLRKRVAYLEGCLHKTERDIAILSSVIINNLSKE